MTDLEEHSDPWGNNTLHLRVESVRVTWSVSEDEGDIDERLTMELQITTEPQNDDLKPFTDRYRRGWVTLMSMLGEHERKTDEGQPAVGVLGQLDQMLNIRVEVHPTFLAGLSTLVGRTADAPIRVSVQAYKQLSDWNGEDWLLLRHCAVAVGSINVSNEVT